MVRVLIREAYERHTSGKHAGGLAEDAIAELTELLKKMAVQLRRTK